MAVKATTNEWERRAYIAGHLPYGATRGFPDYMSFKTYQDRWPPSNNPIQTPLNWRYPSAYLRYVRKFPSAESSVRNAGWYRIYIPPGHDENGMNLISNIDGFTDGWSVLEDLDIRKEAEVRALSRIGDRKIAFGEAIAEADKTYSHVARTCSDLLRAYQAAHRGHWRQIPGILGMSWREVLHGRFPANRWLEYQYGWKPLLNTIYDGYNLLTQQLRQPLIIFGKGTGQRKYRGSGDFEWTDWDGIVYRARVSAEQSCRVSLWARYDNSPWSDLHKLSLINPLAIAWELVPYSFVLDWFMPVGNVLEASTANSGLTFISGSYTYRTQGSKLNAATRVVNWPPLEKPGYLYSEQFGMRRSPYYDWPSPSFYFTQNPFSNEHTANALALWRGSIKHR